MLKTPLDIFTMVHSEKLEKEELTKFHQKNVILWSIEQPSNHKLKKLYNERNARRMLLWKVAAQYTVISKNKLLSQNNKS